MKQIYLLLILTALLSGCAALVQGTAKMDDAYIVEVDTQAVEKAIAELDAENAYTIRFSSGSTTLTKREQKKLNKMLNDRSPTVVVVQGTAGTEKYRNLGNQRRSAVIEHITRYGINVIPKAYDPTAPGLRGFVWIPEQQQWFDQNGKMLMITRKDQ